MNVPLVENLTPIAARDRVVDEVEEVAPDRRLAAADVDVEHLQPAQLVDHRFGLVGGQLARIATPRRRQAVDARQVAGVRQLPRQADRRVEPALQLVRPARSRNISDSINDAIARSNAGRRSVGDRRRRRRRRASVGCAGSASTTRTRSRCLRNTRRAVAVVVGEGAERLGPQRRPAGAARARDRRARRRARDGQVSPPISRRRTCRRSRSPRSTAPRPASASTSSPRRRRRDPVFVRCSSVYSVTSVSCSAAAELPAFGGARCRWPAAGRRRRRARGRRGCDRVVCSTLSSARRRIGPLSSGTRRSSIAVAALDLVAQVAARRGRSPGRAPTRGRSSASRRDRRARRARPVAGRRPARAG